MGYLSCKAESSISTSTTDHKTRNQKNQPKRKPIKLQTFSYADLETATDNFSDQNLLGRGSHGSVYRAVLPVSGLLAAVKRPSSAATEADNEIQLLSSIQSPCFVNLIGFTHENESQSPTRDRNRNRNRNRLLVVEYMPNGTLYDAVHSGGAKQQPPPSWARRIKLSLQIAKAIETLHSLHPPIIHRDIKSANVLIDKSFNAKLGDFGLAIRCEFDDFRIRMTPPAGTMGYIDPHYVTPENLSTKSDVFSFGILLLELISGRKAIDVAYSPPSIVDWAIPLIRRGKFLAVFDPRIEPLRDGMVAKQLAVIAAKCVRSCRERRPSMREVSWSLCELSKLVPVNSWNGFVGNPCMMVETMGGQPVGSGKSRLDSRVKEGNFDDDLDGRFAAKPLRHSRKVYSDLGFRNNLMDLMAVGNDEVAGGCDDKVEHRSNSVNKSSNFGMRNGRFVGRSSRFVRDDDDDDGKGGLGLFRIKRNQSVGGSSELYSRRNDMIT